jgi:hypothetical protein
MREEGRFEFMEDEFQDILPPPAPAGAATVEQVLQGIRIPAQQQILLYSAGQWELFIQEWAHFCLKKLYKQVQRFSGAGDRGIDVAGFKDAKKLQGIWDNYQCKHYDHPLRPTDAWPELGKILWYTFNKEYKTPRQYYFVAPRGVGTKLAGYLADTAKLKEALIANWDNYVRKNITDKHEVPLEGEFRQYVEAFDFSIFDSTSPLRIVEDHRKCPYHAFRFGGGLPARPASEKPPADIAPEESRYVTQLFRAYSDHTKKAITGIKGLRGSKKLNDHFGRQREAFYHAESLRVFARDTVPPGTFESLQEDIFSGVIDVHDAEHADGFIRICMVTKAAREIQLTSNALMTCAKPQDRDGICHQLANEDRLEWTKS